MAFLLHHPPDVWTEVWWQSLTLPEIPVAFPQPWIQIQKASRSQTSDCMGEKLQGCLCGSKEGGIHRAARSGMRTLAGPELLRQAVRVLREVYQLWLHQFLVALANAKEAPFQSALDNTQNSLQKMGEKSTQHFPPEKREQNRPTKIVSIHYFWRKLMMKQWLTQKILINTSYNIKGSKYIIFK